MMIKFSKSGMALLAAGLLLGTAGMASADEIGVAVAANFTEPATEIAAGFEAETGHKVSLSFGSSGKLYAQITQGAPFVAFLSADAARPAAAEADGFGVAGTSFTYAIGQLALWSANPTLIDVDGAVLKSGGFAHLAIANPESAPYGKAAVETLQALGVADALNEKMVMGDSITQTFQFVQSGNAELGFVARSQIAGMDDGSRWVVPPELYAPILQNAVLLKPGKDSAAARAFIDYLKGDKAKEIIEAFGYGLPDR